MTEITDFARLVSRDQGLCVVSTLRGDQTIQSSVVNAGVLDHPVTGRPVVGLVARGGSRKLAHLRANPRATIVVRAGWEWAAAEGPAELAGPLPLITLDDTPPSWPARPIRCPGSARESCRRYCERSSPQPGGATTTGRPTTA